MQEKSTYVAVGRERPPRSLEAFLTRRLKFSPQETQPLLPAKFQKMGSKPGSKIVGEFVVTFPTSQARDVVRSAARNLAGDSLAGMRLHIPGFLESNFKALENVSYNLKQKYPGIKRNIKYDDMNRDLVLDFLLGPGGQWRSIRPDQARQFASLPRSENPSNRSISAADISDLLGIPVVPAE